MYVLANEVLITLQEREAMTVKQLIDLLVDMNPEAEVTMMSQPSWPMEYSLRGVAERQAFDRKKPQDEKAAPNDVVLIEGQWLRYGSRDAWGGR